MSIEIVQAEDTNQFSCGNASPFRGQWWPSIGVLRPKAKSIHGIAFNNIDALEIAVNFLTRELDLMKKEKKNERKPKNVKR